MFLATQPKEDEKATVSQLTTDRADTTVRSWPVLEPISCSFFTPLA